MPRSRWMTSPAATWGSYYQTKTRQTASGCGRHWRIPHPSSYLNAPALSCEKPGCHMGDSGTSMGGGRCYGRALGLEVLCRYLWRSCWPARGDLYPFATLAVPVFWGSRRGTGLLLVFLASWEGGPGYSRSSVQAGAPRKKNSGRCQTALLSFSWPTTALEGRDENSTGCPLWCVCNVSPTLAIPISSLLKHVPCARHQLPFWRSGHTGHKTDTRPCHTTSCPVHQHQHQHHTVHSPASAYRPASGSSGANRHHPELEDGPGPAASRSPAQGQRLRSVTRPSSRRRTSIESKLPCEPADESSRVMPSPACLARPASSSSPSSTSGPTPDNPSHTPLPPASGSRSPSAQQSTNITFASRDDPRATRRSKDPGLTLAPGMSAGPLCPATWARRAPRGV
jgi:hypothetical protein